MAKQVKDKKMKTIKKSNGKMNGHKKSDKKNGSKVIKKAAKSTPVNGKKSKK